MRDGPNVGEWRIVYISMLRRSFLSGVSAVCATRNARPDAPPPPPNMVSAESGIGTQVGADILLKGGNAIDANNMPLNGRVPSTCVKLLRAAKSVTGLLLIQMLNMLEHF